jgi:hypothetical protein
MAGRGRPRHSIPPYAVHVKLTLHPESDADLIRAFEECPRGARASWIKAALRGNNTVSPVKRSKTSSGRGLSLADFGHCEY